MPQSFIIFPALFFINTKWMVYWFHKAVNIKKTLVRVPIFVIGKRKGRFICSLKERKVINLPKEKWRPKFFVKKERVSSTKSYPSHARSISFHVPWREPASKQHRSTKFSAMCTYNLDEPSLQWTPEHPCARSNLSCSFHHFCARSKLSCNFNSLNFTTCLSL